MAGKCYGLKVSVAARGRLLAVKAKFRCPPASKVEMSLYSKESENEAYRVLLHKSGIISYVIIIFPL
ncbi:hypothetical protein BS412_06500 [Cronobacter turicensis]|uniref:Uncharacterized protein n=1 Tax=Cronobacter turicensis TaxID=413502 RepID=A0A2T7AY66_9ENTR|nr:hypothetical protein BS411_20400 [Cronobacter turicensis]PUX38293.1 hypothetical protein BS412_06500 [Cronobacter turicensis]